MATTETETRTLLNPEDPASGKQLVFLHSLVRQVGVQPKFPKNKQEASDLINKLKKKLP